MNFLKEKYPAIDSLKVSVCTVPTDYPEQDGTLSWKKTGITIVEVAAAGRTGIGYTYGGKATGVFVQDQLAEVVKGRDALSIAGAREAMFARIRNHGRPGIASMAIAAVDAALWDLKARLLEMPLVTLLGAVRDGLPIYGSGGFTTYPIEKLQEQLAAWAGMGIPRVKMKVGAHPEQDLERVKAAREAIGPGVELFVDGNGAYDRKQALGFAERFAECNVKWFEEPVSSDDLAGLRLLRDRGPAGMSIAAGEYGYDLFYFRRMLEAQSVDVLQADATRCAGISVFLQVGGLCGAFGLPLSGHTAPSIHAHPGCAMPSMIHLEYFHDHVRIERMLFDGTLRPEKGKLYPDLSQPGMGLELKRSEIEKYAA